MDIMEKLSILGQAARYDVSCSSSGSNNKGGRVLQKKTKAIGNVAPGGICHTWSDDGRCISLLKILLTNHCEYNCLYCANRRDNNITRAAFTPGEIASLTIEFYKRNYIEGLFLSSGVIKSPEYTMSLLLETLKLLRNDHSFRGYIHVKTIPGASKESVYELGLLADRMSVNIEFCNENTLKLLAPQKFSKDMLAPMSLIHEKKKEFDDCAKNKIRPPVFVPAGQSTQLVIGAKASENDFTVLSLTQKLYSKLNLKRVYYSAYIPVNTHPNLPAVNSPAPFLREHRLYQADWLMRFYGFKAGEIIRKDNPFLSLTVDPKCDWAINNFDLFPVEINRADYPTLLRVPGIGMIGAKRILEARKYRNLKYEDARKLGIVLKRASFFLTFSGRYFGESFNSTDELRFFLADKRGKEFYNPKQITLEELNVLSV